MAAVDSTGAGDVFAAGMLYGLTHGQSWPQAGRLGSRVASRVIAGLGARLHTLLGEDEVAELTSGLDDFS